MADVRSMLRAERASRRITHPHASYSSSGSLSCNICDAPVKSEKAWGAHLHSSQHTSKLNERREKDVNGGLNGSKKRKAVEFEEPKESETKRAKPAASEDDEDEVETTVLIHDAGEPVFDDEAGAAAELAALQNDLAALEQASRLEVSTALNAPATISAPAMRAEDLADQARQEQAKQRSRRAEEIEEDREDAARALETEFEEMDSLQERARKLRERREALRKPVAGSDNIEATIPNGNATIDRGIPDRTMSADGEAVEQEDSDDSEEDDWVFGAR